MKVQKKGKKEKNTHHYTKASK